MMPDPMARRLHNSGSMSKHLPLLPLALLVGCPDGGGQIATLEAPPYRETSAGADDDSTTGAPGDDDESDTPYGVSLASLQPAPDSTDHLYRDPIVLTYTGDARGVGVQLYGPDREEIDVSVWWAADGTLCRVTPVSGALLPLTEYEAVVSFGASAQSWTFTTAALGSPMPSPYGVSGRTFALTFLDARFLTPAALAPTLSTALGDRALLWTFVDVGQDDGDGASLGVDASVGSLAGEVWTQDGCATDAAITQSFGGMTLENPYFSRPSGELRVTVGAAELVIEDAEIDGDFTPDGQGIRDGGLRGWLRSSSADPLFGGEEGDACLAFVNLGASCEPCPSDPSTSCLRLEVDHVTGTGNDASLTEYADADCPDGPQPLFSCQTASGLGSPLVSLLLAGWIGRRKTLVRATRRTDG